MKAQPIGLFEVILTKNFPIQTINISAGDNIVPTIKQINANDVICII